MGMTMEALSPGNETVELRLAEDADNRALMWLAGRDTRPLAAGPHVVALRDGRIDAALSLATGEAVADPFVRTAELVELLRCHARAMPVPQSDRAPRPRARLRGRPVTA
jgi:hypothetical protein